MTIEDEAGRSEGDTGRLIRLNIPMAYVTLNRLRRMHFTEYRSYRRFLAEQIRRHASMDAPRPPFGFARITVARYALQLPDLDNLYAGFKPLLDCLVTQQDGRHPDGMGFLVDDNPLRMTLGIRPGLAASRSEERTEVEIAEIDPTHPVNRTRIEAMGATLSMIETMERSTKKPKRMASAKGCGKQTGMAARMTAAEYLSMVKSKKDGRRKVRWV